MNYSFLFTILTFIFIKNCGSSIISLKNLQIFFRSTYDMNHDGKASVEEFINYFRIMEPQADITRQDVIDTFQLLDSNNDHFITLQQLLEISKIKIGYRTGHKQIHLGLTENYDQMQIMWVSNPQSYQKPVVQYGFYPTKLNLKTYAIVKTYNVGHYGFHGKIYKAVLSGLQPNIRYYYRVGDIITQTFSQIKYFKSRPALNQHLPQINFAIFGDMGTFAPCGHLVINQIARDNFVKPFDFTFLAGDIAYAGISSQKKGQIQPIWDLFGQLTQSFTAYAPFMPGVGNHEKYYNFSAYTARYQLPRHYSGQTNLWFSFSYGQIHIIYFSSQHSFTPGSEQYYFIQNDLKYARQNPNIKWVIIGCHRPFYSWNQRQFSNQTDLAKNLQQLINTYKVDIVLNGHIHSYQRSWPMYKSKPQKQPHNETHFKNPSHPIYVVQATAGALQYQRWLKPSPEYAIKQMNKYGYGKVTIKDKTLRYQFIHAVNGKVLDQWYITKE